MQNIPTTSDVSYSLPPLLTIETVDELTADFVRILGEHPPLLTLEASRTEVLTTPGVQLLVTLDDALSLDGGALRIAGPSRACEDAFAILGFSSWLSERKVAHG